jgi:hypothetical protein
VRSTKAPEATSENCVEPRSDNLRLLARRDYGSHGEHGYGITKAAWTPHATTVEIGDSARFIWKNDLRRSDQLEKLRVRFLAGGGLCGHLGPGYSGLPAELDEVRRELMSMSEGVDFLLDLLEELEINEVNDYCPQSTAHCFR